MTAKILLVNPPIFDFAAYDFWLKPYGLLSVAGKLRGHARLTLFDYLDRLNPFVARQKSLESDTFGRGKFYHRIIPPPKCLINIPRYFRRFGLPRHLFQNLLKESPHFDFVLVQTMMTYWYPGLQEVIHDLRTLQPKAKIILGGVYATLCSTHAASLGPDLLVTASNLEPLFGFLGIEPQIDQSPLWEAYNRLSTGVLKLTDGCPFNCTYCAAHSLYPDFRPRPLDTSIAELNLLLQCGARNIAFYDDALLCRPQDALIPFLQYVLHHNINVNFHTPNALNARLLTPDLAQLMLRAGFKTFYIGFENLSTHWRRQTGDKVTTEEFANAVKSLLDAGAEPRNITAYLLLGHPDADCRRLEESMKFVHSLGIKGMLADFSPIPGTPDGRSCAKWGDMKEPLMHNKTAFPIIRLGFDNVNHLKNLQRQLNKSL